MATSPSDQNNKNVLAWLDRLQSSVRDAGKDAGPRAFFEPRSPETLEDSDVDDSDKRTLAQTEGGPGKDDSGNDDNEQALQEAEKLQSSLPDSHVPLGLIADLSLSNKKANKKRNGAKETAISEEDLDGNNVVCLAHSIEHFQLNAKLRGATRVLQTIHTLCPVQRQIWA